LVEKSSPSVKMAMKIIRLGRVGTSEYDEASHTLDAEMRVGVSLAGRSPFLLQISEYFIENGYCFLIMEYCSGGDLRKVFNKIKKGERVKLSRLV
jgi:serine/threonine protein kinase